MPKQLKIKTQALTLFLDTQKIAYSQDHDTLQNHGRDYTRFIPPSPSLITFPASTAQVSALLAYCNEHQLAVVPSGGRTGLSGGALAAQGEIVLSLDRMNQILELHEPSLTLKVQAGVITEHVHEHVRDLGLTWPIDFGAKGSSHIGGNISTNAGGVRVIRYGLTRHWVLGLTVVLMDGTVLTLNGSLEKNNTGLDLRQLFIGTEGTLGIITEATLKLCALPLAERTRVFLFEVPDMTTVLELFNRVRRHSDWTVSAFEMMDEASYQTSCSHLHSRPPLAPTPSLFILLEVEAHASEAHAGNTQNKSDSALAEWMEQGLIINAVEAQNTRERREFWRIRESIAESVVSRGLTHKNDVSVAIAQLTEFMVGLSDFFRAQYKNSELEIFIYGHIGDGNLHINILKPQSMEQKNFEDLCHRVDLKLFARLKELGGSISAEHGIGVLKKDALHFSRTPAELAVMLKIKQALDPQGLLNPGKIF